MRVYLLSSISIAFAGGPKQAGSLDALAMLKDAKMIFKAGRKRYRPHHTQISMYPRLMSEFKDLHSTIYNNAYKDEMPVESRIHDSDFDSLFACLPAFVGQHNQQQQ